MRSLTTDYDPLDRLLAATDADAFIHVGDRSDPIQLYLTRFHGPDRPYAFVYDGTARLCAPALFAEQARREFDGQVVSASTQTERDPALRAATLCPAEATIAVLPSLAVEHIKRLEDAGGVVETVDPAPLAAARRRKRPAERERLRRVQRATQAGMARAERVLAAATPDGDDLRWEGAPLTTERLRRQVNAALAERGVTDAVNTVIGAGPTCADLHFVGEDAIHPGETVLLDVSPRGPDGYHGDFSRTFVAGDPGEWEQAAHTAVDAALKAALEALSDGAGTEGAAVRAAVDEALALHDIDEAEMTHGPGHGVGLALHESPGYDGRFHEGDIITVEPGLYDPARGGVRLEELVIVRADDIERVGDYPRTLAPRPDAAD
ncbi:M24 family metallopeptidase [Halosegnis sp.]|uniref:M24 family metallopeptidase n=1 Tax=Halosegnis sp. TaxID=2864959 RepID=UPI0035D468A1